jgi:hypothetical protein
MSPMAKFKGAIPLAALEFKIRYSKPMFDSWFRESGPIAAALFDAFAKWNIRSQDVSLGETRLLGTKAMVFSLLNRKLLFAVSIEDVVITISNPSWSEVEDLVEIVDAGISALVGVGRVVPASAEGVLTFHFTLQGVTPLELTSRFVQVRGTEIAPDGLGFAIYQDSVQYIVDKSQVYPNSIFIQITRTLEGQPKTTDAAATLLADQGRLMNLLDLEEAV